MTVQVRYTESPRRLAPPDPPLTLPMFRFPGVRSVAELGAVLLTGRRVGAGEYVGVDHPAGELRLRLEADGRFSLRLAVWDAVVGEFVGQRELTGEWRQRWSGLELCSGGREVVYSRARGGARGWVWQRSTLPTFADGVALLPERRATSTAKERALARRERRRFS